jgi:hypothetical protein
MSSLGTSATNWSIVPDPDDRCWMWNSRWNENWQGKPKYSEEICPSATLSTTNPAWLDLGSNPDGRGGKPATNRLSYGAAFLKLSNVMRNDANLNMERVLLLLNYASNNGSSKQAIP